jgi:hypothetical protein
MFSLFLLPQSELKQQAFMPAADKHQGASQTIA